MNLPEGCRLYEAAAKGAHAKNMCSNGLIKDDCQCSLAAKAGLAAGVMIQSRNAYSGAPSSSDRCSVCVMSPKAADTVVLHSQSFEVASP